MPDSRKKSRIEKKHWLILGCIGLIAVLALLYLFIYIPANEKHLNIRLFNSLSRTTANIRNKQDNTFNLLRGLLPKPNQVINDAYREYFEKGFSGKQKLDHKIKNAKEEPFLDSLFKKSPNAIYVQSLFNSDTIRYQVNKENKNQIETISLNYSTEDFFYPLLNGTPFDGFLIVVDGKIIYETLPSGMAGTRFDSLIRIDKIIDGTNIRQLDISGNAYRAFIGQFDTGNEARGIIIGLKDYNNFLQEKNQLPSSQVLIVIMFTMIVMVLLPWFKLFNLGKKDRLTILDGAFCFIVAMLLMSFLFFGFISTLPMAINGQTEKAMQSLADTIAARSQRNLDTMEKRIDQFNDIVLKNDLVGTNLTGLRNPLAIGNGKHYTSGKPKEVSKAFADSIVSLFKQDSIIQFFVLDGNTGNEVMNWTNYNWNAPPSNFSMRKYFIEQKKGKKPVSIEQVMSLTTGSFRTILAKRVPQDGINLITCLSFELSPLMNTVLPEGYSFAIADPQGNVLYHKDAFHNLNEFLPEETDQKESVISILKNTESKYLEAKYKGTSSRMFFKPFQSGYYDYRIVIFYNKDFESVRDTGIFSITTILLLAFFIIGLLQMLIVFFASSGKRKLNLLKMETDWIWPKPSLSLIYLYAGWYQLFVIVHLLVMHDKQSFLVMVFALLISVSLITLFLNFLFIDYYNLLGRKIHANYKKRIIFFISLIYFLLNGVSFFIFRDIQEELTSLLLFQIMQVFVGFIFYFFFRNRIRKTGNDRAAKTSNNNRYFLGNYSFLAITRLIISSGIPIWLFYQHAFQHQLGNIARLKHISFIEAVQKMPGFTHYSPNDQNEKVYVDNFWIIPEKSEVPSGLDHPFTKMDAFLINLFTRLRVYQNSLSRDIDGAAFYVDTSSRFSFSPTPLHNLAPKKYSTEFKLSPDEKTRFSTDLMGYGLIGNTYVLMFIVIPIMVILLPRFLIKVIRKIFALDVPGIPIDPELAATLATFSTGSKLNYITGLPGSRKMKFIRTHTPEEGRRIVDLFNMPIDIHTDKLAKLIIFNHFEYVIYDKEKVLIFVGLLEKYLTLSTEPAIFILSTLHIDRAVIMMTEHFGESESDTAISIKEKLQVLFGHFNAIILPIRSEVSDIAHAGHQTTKDKWLEEEFTISPFIERLQIPIKNSMLLARQKGTDVTHNNSPIQGSSKEFMLKNYNAVKNVFDNSWGELKEDATWNLHSIILPFYHHIWQSLSPEERYLVYDLAEEGLVNPANKYHLGILIQKGLIKRAEDYGQLELMNDSFRLFVLLAVDKGEATEIGKSLKGSSSWEELKNPIMLLIIGIFAIILVSQQRVFSSLVGYLTAIAALIPTLNVIFSLLKSGNSPKA